MNTPIFNTRAEALKWQIEQAELARKELEEIERAEREKLRAVVNAAEIEAYAEYEEHKKNEKFVVTIAKVHGRQVVTESKYDQNFLNALRETPGRLYSNGGLNSIPVDEWEAFVMRANEYVKQGINWKYSDGTKEKLDELLAEPVWHISLDKYGIVIRTRSNNTGIIYSIPGATYYRNESKFQIPRSEGWQLWNGLKNEKKVKWEPDVLEFIKEQLEKRAILDNIATMERGDKYRDFAFDSEGKFKLREFQEVGAEFIDSTGIRCLLADEMGLGKTWQSLAVAVKNNLRTLIICPASLKSNWSREVLKLTGQHAHVLRGAAPNKLDFIHLLTEPTQFTIINYDILSRSEEYKKETHNAEGYKVLDIQTRYPWAELINMYKPELVILDEGHYIKNTDSNRSKAVLSLEVPHVIPMTGTPVLNRPGELWPLLHMIDERQFPSIDTFLRQYTYDGKRAKNVEELRNVLKSMMIRRLKRDVMKDLPAINRIHEYHELGDKANALYQRVLMGIYRTIDAAGSEIDKAIPNILVQIQRLKQVCAIDKVSHTADLATELYDQTDESEHRKVLIFSQYKMTAFKIAQQLELDNECLCFVRQTARYENGKRVVDFVTADNAERDRIVQKFQNEDRWKYLVVTEKTTKEGHNITAAGHVIFNDLFWTPAGHEQAEGRAYGRTSDPHGINSYYMITDMGGKSIDEWIMALLAEKMRTIEEVVEGVESSRDTSIVSDLIRKFKEGM